MSPKESDKALTELWRHRHDAGTCNVCCYICVKEIMVQNLETAEK